MIARLLSLVLACSLASCSWSFVKKAPDSPPATRAYVDCTDSRVAPVIDTVGAALFVIPTMLPFYLASVDPEFRDDNEDFKLLAIWGAIFGGATLAYGLSARSGFSSAKRCRQMRAAASPMSPAGYDQPAPPP